MRTLFFILMLVSVSGCGTFVGRVAGGGTVVAVDGVEASARQSQDPKAPTSQDVVSDTETTRILPAGTVVESWSGTNLVQRYTLGSPSSETVVTHRSALTKVGEAQKNAAQEIAAKLAGVRWIQWLGVVILLFGGASMFWPPLRLVINSVTASMFCMGAGAAMIFLPLLIVGHEVLILGCSAGIAALWFLAHRHGGASSEARTLKSLLGKGPVP